MRFAATDAAALRCLTLERLTYLVLTARVREYNQLAIDIWRAANPMPTAKT